MQHYVKSKFQIIDEMRYSLQMNNFNKDLLVIIFYDRHQSYLFPFQCAYKQSVTIENINTNGVSN